MMARLAIGLFLVLLTKPCLLNGAAWSVYDMSSLNDYINVFAQQTSLYGLQGLWQILKTEKPSSPLDGNTF